MKGLLWFVVRRAPVEGHRVVESHGCTQWQSTDLVVCSVAPDRVRSDGYGLPSSRWAGIRYASVPKPGPSGGRHDCRGAGCRAFRWRLPSGNIPSQQSEVFERPSSIGPARHLDVARHLDRSTHGNVPGLAVRQIDADLECSRPPVGALLRASARLVDPWRIRTCDPSSRLERGRRAEVLQLGPGNVGRHQLECCTRGVHTRCCRCCANET